MSAHVSTVLDTQPRSERLPVALIGPDEGKRQALARALTEICSVDVRDFDSYPPERNDLPQILAEHFKVVIVDVDADPDVAFDLVERIGSDGTLTVMVYSECHDPSVAVRFMRAGACEYLPLPVEQHLVEEAFGRIAPAVRAKVRTEIKKPDMLALAGPKQALAAGLFLELPKTLPADFIDWDSNDLPQMVLGNADHLETVPCTREISNPPERRAEHKALLEPSKCELNNPVPHFEWSVLADVRAGFPGRVVQKQDTRSVKAESPGTSRGSGAPIVEGKEDTLEVGELKMREADELLFQIFRSAPKPPKRMKFANKAGRLFRRGHQLTSLFDEPHAPKI